MVKLGGEKWIDRYFNKQNHTRKAEQQPNLNAEPLSPRSANRSTAPRAPLRCEVQAGSTTMTRLPAHPHAARSGGCRSPEPSRYDLAACSEG
jgi:hypothetical protein